MNNLRGPRRPSNWAHAAAQIGAAPRHKGPGGPVRVSSAGPIAVPEFSNNPMGGPGAGFNGFMQTRPFTLQAGQALPLAQDDNLRLYVMLQNTGAGELRIAFGEPATATSFRIDPGGFYEPWLPPNNSISVFGVGATTGVLIIGSAITRTK